MIGFCRFEISNIKHAHALNFEAEHGDCTIDSAPVSWRSSTVEREGHSIENTTRHNNTAKAEVSSVGGPDVEEYRKCNNPIGQRLSKNHAFLMVKRSFGRQPIFLTNPDSSDDGW